MNKTILLSTLLLGSLAFSSCSSDEEIKNEQKISRNITKDLTFTAVGPVTVADGQNPWSVFSGAYYLLTFDEVAHTVTMAVDGLEYAEDEDPISFTVENLPQSRESNYYLERGVDFAGPVAVMAGGEAHTLSDIRIYVMLDERRVFNGNYEHSYFIGFTLDDEYIINAVQRTNYYFGTTATAGGVTPAYTTDNTYYKVTLDPKKLRADISLYRPKFAQNMPAFNEMQFQNIPFALTAAGVSLESASLVPQVYMGDAMVPGTNFTVTDLTGVVQFPGKSFTGAVIPGVTVRDNDFTLRFTVGDRGTVDVAADIIMPDGFRIP